MKRIEKFFIALTKKVGARGILRILFGAAVVIGLGLRFVPEILFRLSFILILIFLFLFFDRFWDKITEVDMERRGWIKKDDGF